MIIAITVKNFTSVKRQGFVFNRVSAVVAADAITRIRVVAKAMASGLRN